MESFEQANPKLEIFKGDISMNPSRSCDINTPHSHQWGGIDTLGLEALLNADLSMTLVDARPDQWFDGMLIQGAERLPADATEHVMGKTLPHKNQLIVVYCAGEGCSSSHTLAKRLSDSGYENIIEYHGGIREWKALSKPIQTL